MTVPFQHDDAARATARQAYETLEPLHVLAYFSPHLGELAQSAGLDWSALYAGARGGPLGAAAPSVVTACFFNFSPEVVEPAWRRASEHGLEQVMALREQAVDRSLREALGDRVDDPALPGIVSRLRGVAEAQTYAGRPLASAWAAQPWPQQPHLGLWHATAVLREWRGDGHLAVLVQAGFAPTEAVVFHEASHPDPAVRKRGLGRKLAQVTRGWSEEQWLAAAGRLADRGLLRLEDGTETMTDEGAALYDAMEAATDDAAVWAGDEDAAQLLGEVRPFVKAVIDAGILPGTKR